MMSRILPVALVAGLLLAGCAAVEKVRHHQPAATAAAAPACGARDINVYFEGQTADITSEAKEVIDLMARSLDGCRIDHVRIVGFTDEGGLVEANDELSRQRALAMSAYLEEHYRWPHDSMEKRAAGERGAVNDQGEVAPMRRRARIVVESSAP